METAMSKRKIPTEKRRIEDLAGALEEMLWATSGLTGLHKDDGTMKEFRIEDFYRAFRLAARVLAREGIPTWEKLC